MILAALLLATPSVRPKPVEGHPIAMPTERPSTSSGRTEEKPRTALDAERAFAADAQRIGQWAAFRKWATADAIMFLPQPTPMQEATRSWPEPKQAVTWSPAISYVSCDGRLAVNTGPWRQPDGGVGYFSTVWARQSDGGWKWRVDGGDQLSTARASSARPSIRRASCRTPHHLPEPPLGVETKVGSGSSPDRTLVWWFEVTRSGARTFEVMLWNGERFELVLRDRIAAPKTKG